MWAHFPLRGAQGGGLLGGSGNGISTAGLYLTLGDAESASQAPKMLPWGASSWSIFFPLVTTKLDKVAGVDYSLVAPPRATANNLDWLLKVRLIKNHTPSRLCLRTPTPGGFPSSLETNLTMTPPPSYPSSPLSPVHLPCLLLAPITLTFLLVLKCTMTAASPGPLHLLLLLARRLSPRYRQQLSLPSFKSLLKYPLPREALPDQHC